MFFWEAQPPDIAEKRPPQRAVFTLSYPSPDVCLIVRIEKTLQVRCNAHRRDQTTHSRLHIG